MLARATAPRLPGRAGTVALSCAVAWALWSSASVLWARDPAWAWQAAGRAWLVTGVLGLVLLWPGTAAPAVRARMAAGVVSAIALAQAAAGWAAALGGSELADGRLRGSLPYANAYAMLMVAGALAALGCAAAAPGAADARAARAARAGWAALAVVLLATGLAAQSRSSLPALAAGLLVLGALAAPLRAVAAPALAALGATALTVVPVLDLRNAALAQDAAPQAARALLWIAAAALVAGAVAWWSAPRATLPEDRRPHTARRRLLLAAAAAAALVPVAAALASHADYDRIESASTRFSAGAGSNRPDMWRVALEQARAHPVLGIGAGNFKRPYLQARRTSVSPRFAHSLPAEALVTLGAGGLLLVAGMLGALLAGAVGRRPALPAAGLAAAGAAVLAQALVDWSTELSVVAVVLVVALAACHAPRPAPASPGGPRDPAWPAVALALLTAVAALALAPLAAAGRIGDTATRAGTSPGVALDRLALAARLTPLDPRPLESRALVALRAGRPDVARDAAAQALRRDGDDWMALWLNGVLALDAGRRGTAVALLDRAAAANPSERAVRLARSAAGRGERLDLLDASRTIFGDRG